MVLSAIVPAATALPNAPAVVYSTGIITSIDEGTVSQIPDPSYPFGFYWNVQNRHVALSLSGRTLSGDFVLTYSGKFDAFQGGSLTGVMKGDHKEFAITGNTTDVNPNAPLAFTPEGYPMYPLSISGDWKGTEGSRDAGTFTGIVVFIPTPDGQHIAAIVPSLSSFEMDLVSHGNGGDDGNNNNSNRNVNHGNSNHDGNNGNNGHD